MIKININRRIRVKLTDKGKEILNKWIAEGNKLCGMEPDFIPSSYQEDEDGYIYPQLWDFMDIFGPHLFVEHLVTLKTTQLFLMKTNFRKGRLVHESSICNQ